MGRVHIVGTIALVVATTACDGDSGSGPPRGSGAGGSGVGGSAGAGASSGSSGSSGDAGSAGDGSGGSAGSSGSAGSGSGGAAGGSDVELGPNCPTGDAALVWKTLAGKYTLIAPAFAPGYVTYFTEGQLYEFEVDPATCSLVFQTDSGEMSCTWDGSQWDYALETVADKVLTIHLQGPIDNSTENTCEFNYHIDLGKPGNAILILPDDSGGVLEAP